MISRIEAALETVAELIANGDVEFLPIFMRLEKELETARQSESAIDRARRIARDRRAA